MSKPLRQSMPGIAAFIDQMREVFGAEDVDGALRAANEGQPTFCLRAPDGSVLRGVPFPGTAVPVSAPALSLEQMRAREKKGQGV
jgi:hypothetical protein